LNLFKKLGENGAPGMRPNYNKVVYFQYLSVMSFWKSGPESGFIILIKKAALKNKRSSYTLKFKSFTDAEKLHFRYARTHFDR
jgi:hypothetical protein